MTAVRSWRAPGSPRLLILGLLLLAPFAGMLAASKPFLAGTIVLGLGVLFAVVIDLRILPVFLVVTMFVESLELGAGLRIGRLAAVLALGAIALYVLARGKVTLRVNALLLVVVAFGLWMLLSSYWATNPDRVFYNLYSYGIAVAYLLAFALLVREHRDFRAMFLAFGICAGLFGILSFADYLGAGGSAAIGEEGLQGDQNLFALYQIAALPPCLALAAEESRPGRRALYFGFVAVIVLSVISSLSRGGLVTLGAVVLATLVLPWRYFFRTGRDRIKYVLALIIASMLTALAGAAAFLDRARTILNATDPRGDRGSGRTDLWAAAWHGFSDHPWLGLGAGNFQDHSLELLLTTPGVNAQANYVGFGRVVHNMYLSTLTELGVVGFVLFMSLLVLTATSLVGSMRRARASHDATYERCGAALLAVFFGICVSGIFLSLELGKLIWIIVGSALALEVATRTQTESGAQSRRAVIAATIRPATSSQVYRSTKR